MPNEQPTRVWSGRFREPLNRTFEQWQRSFPFDWRLLTQLRVYSPVWALAAVCLMGWLTAQAQVAPTAPAATGSALVTFYTHHAYFYSGLPGTKAVFTGHIADGDTELFSFRPGYAIQNNAHLTLQIPAGLHEFKAYEGTDASKKTGLRVELKAGQHYYLKATANDHGVIVVDLKTGQIELVDCATAHEELAKNKVLPFKKVTPTVSAMIVPDQTIEPCMSDGKSASGIKEDANGK